MVEQKMLETLLRIESKLENMNNGGQEEFITDEKPVFNTQEMAEMIGCHVDTIRRNCREGKIPHKKFSGKFIFPREQIIEWLRDSRGNWQRPAGDELSADILQFKNSLNPEKKYEV
ncbi:helix-turn-helix domain-containing protein [Halarsenatibacter silvermanii]|uniref:DNA binding domain-containing protein, excisionase family n=1 Tax=Halarsenatibacter silvermanii TaxID=321763 RepID=A0A1G9NKL0_9FIRM|nr:helix-turn-helix domain-containing protein [Halarsenatibacter silvermanii]SDL87142.1 DNA binding domain-containing protein, excisionase family [Halarsenatibacter silvermanii]